MTHLSSKRIFEAFDYALEVSSRWPRLLLSLGFDMTVGRPEPLLLNNALESRGFRRIIDERDSVRAMLKDTYPDAWWFAIAEETTGRRDATVRQVVDAVTERAAQHAAQ